MRDDIRERLIQKILDDNDNETLFNLLNLDLDDVFRKTLESKTNDELLEIIL